MSNVAAGNLRHRMLIQEQISSRDSDGILQVDWVDWATVSASLEPMSAREFIQSGQMQSAAVARVQMRYRAGLKASMRFVYRSQIYNIEGALTDKWSGLEYITIPVSLGVNDGQ